MLSATRQWSDGGLQRVPHIVNYSFPSTTPPEVSSKTRILYLCGITNERVPKIPHSQGWGSPRWDGWFYSDLFYLTHLLHGLGASQKVYTCVSVKELVQEYTEYLHGNPFEERKIVMNREIFEAGDFQSPKYHVSHPDQLRSDFLSHLRSEASEARKNGESLLVVLLAHGDLDSQGIWIGGVNNENPRFIITREHFAEAVGERDLDICIMSTACFSGGWTMRPDILNVTATTAASWENLSESWPVSKSMGRACGSIYSSALTTTSDQLDSKQELSFEDYAKTVLHVCTYHTDRLEDHGFSISAQDDNWGMDYGARTGVPLSHFRARWNLLQGVPPAYENPATNRDASRRNADGTYKEINAPGVLQIAESEALYQNYNTAQPDSLEGMPGSLRSRFGSMQDADPLMRFRKFVWKASQIYHKSLPGKPNVYNNMELESRLFILNSSTDMNFEQLNAILSQIQYRMFLMEQANRFAAFLGVQGPRCQKIDMDVWPRDGLQNQAQKSAFSYARTEISLKRIFGKPATSQGRDFLKPGLYLAACMKDWNKADIDKAVALLVTLCEASITDLKGLVEGSKVVQVKKRRWMESISKVLSSPKKFREN